MERKEGNFDHKPGSDHQEQDELGFGGQRVFRERSREVGNREWRDQARVRFDRRDHHGNQTKQRDQASCQGVNKKLASGITPQRATPDPNQKEQGDQSEFKKDVKQQNIERAKDPNQTGFENQQTGIELGRPILDSGPRDQHGRDRQDGGQQHECQTDSVQSQEELHLDCRATWSGRRKGSRHR